MFFDQLMIAVDENAGITQVCVVCGELPDREILITLEEQTGTAQGTMIILLYVYITHFPSHKQIHQFH